MGSPIDSIPNYVTPFKDKSFLHQKYVVEGLSCEEIATQIFSARTTVLKYLKIHEFRDKGLSYWKIADVLNTMKIPTKTR
jgi:hypothetical protein